MVVFNRSVLGTSAIAPQPGYSYDPEPADDISYLGEQVAKSRDAINGKTELIKRIFDVVLAAAAIALLSPVMLIAAIMIKVESNGPVFYKQERIGKNRRNRERRSVDAYGGLDRRGSSGDRRKNLHAGKPFEIYKLRTMRQDAEKFGPKLAQERDPRITRVGYFMRKTRIDEIPQFINVLKGDMSVIGPRPERSFFINKIKQDLPEFPLRLKVKPGITGLAQVEDGYAQNMEMMRKKIYYDLSYIRDFSIFQEIKILFKTVFVVFTGKGAC